MNPSLSATDMEKRVLRNPLFCHKQRYKTHKPLLDQKTAFRVVYA